GRALVTHFVARDPRPAANRQEQSSDLIAQSYEECHRIARLSHSNFYYAFFLLPKKRRDGLAALYAFMRLVDDVADENNDVSAKQRSLAKWRAALDEAVNANGQAGISGLPGAAA